MGSDPSEVTIPLPKGWTTHVKSALIQSLALAATALQLGHGEVTRRDKRDRHTAELDRAQNEIALLKEELDIKDDRWSRLPPRRRPYYTAVQRMRILQLKAARGWSCEQTARAFLINEQTLRSWLERLDEEGERTLIQTTEPVNRFPDFVRYLVVQLKVLLPRMGKVRIAQVLARAGLHLGVTTVGRILKEEQPMPDDADRRDGLIFTRHRLLTARLQNRRAALSLPDQLPVCIGMVTPCFLSCSRISSNRK